MIQRYEAEEDPYCYPGTSVLRNKFGIEDGATLEALEVELTTARADELLPAGSLDAKHYRSIHHHLFQDLYDWAGQYRSVRISKEQSHFCFPEYIVDEIDRLFDDLATRQHLRGLSSEAFAQAAASVLATLNVIHPFREGNGRTQLTFLLLVAEEAEHPLDLSRVGPDRLLEAMIASFYGDEGPLTGCLLDCTGPLLLP